MNARPGIWISVAAVVLILAVVLDEGEHTASAPGNVVEDDKAMDRVLARNQVASRERSRAGSPSNAVAKPVDSPDARPTREQFQRFRRASFAAPEPDPVSAHRPWLVKGRGIEDVVASATSRGWGFAWIQLDTSFDRERLRTEWRANGVEVLGFSGSYARVRVPALRTAIESLASHSAVRGMGVRPVEEKIATDLASTDGATKREIPVLITLIEDDPDGRWRAELEALGIVVGEWWSEWRAYSANVWSDSLETVAAADFVVGIEPVRIVRSLLDTSVPAMGADHARDYDASSRTFSGTIGSSVAVGIADTGINASHRDISTGRASICGESFQPDDRGAQGRDLWMDYSGHGTHVTGIVAGSGKDRPEFAGIAPGVKHIRTAKVLNRNGAGDSVGVAAGVRYLLRETSCTWRGEESEAVRPQIVNFSLGATGVADGRNGPSRNLDAVIWEASQLYTVAAGNDGSGGLTIEAGTKNALAVGAATDAGVVAGFSSHGPTADGRLAPHLAGMGSAVLSARGNASWAGYARASGTSMAAPSVAGVAALLLDGDDEFRERPALAKARLMASAVKPSKLLGSPAFPSNNTDGPGAFNHEYGLGLVSAGTALDDGPDNAWWHGGDHGTVATGESYEYEIEVPDDTARLDVVLTWIEPPIELISPTTVMADLDLYVDKDGDCVEAACGEHASTSRIDNVEWVFVDAPAAGTYKIRIVAANEFAEPVRTGIAWTAIADSDTPTLTVAAEGSSMQVDAGDAFEIDLQIGVDAYVSSGTTLHLLCRGRLSSACKAYPAKRWLRSSVSRGDGMTAKAVGKMTAAIPLGEIREGEEKAVSLGVPRDVALSSHTLYLLASSWNAVADVVAIEVVVDGEENDTTAVEPAHDSSDAAAVLEGESGEVAVDLLLATREPGEQMVRPDQVRSIKKYLWESRSVNDGFDTEMQTYGRHGSVWYSVEAARWGPYRLTVKESRGVGIAVYRGSVPFDATRIAAGSNKAEFIAAAGGSYLVQVSSDRSQRTPLRLIWDQHPHERPANDDFAERQMITGGRGTVEGTNYRATLEAFEFYGVTKPGATTWFTWSAPEARRYAAQVVPREFNVIVFTGTDTGTLRRVSSMPGAGPIEFPAEAGHEYQIAVLDDGRHLIPDYELEWQPQRTSYHYPNDMIEDATVIEGATGEARWDYWRRRTVETGEHELTGTATAWWRWVAPDDGRHVFRLQDARYEKLAAFKGTSLEELEPVEDGGSVVIDAQTDQGYSLALGQRLTTPFADFDLLWGDIAPNAISWGPAPTNDMPGEAEELAGSTGAASGDHTDATTSDDEPDDIQGHSSLWWSWEAPSTGWQRFELEAAASANLEQPILAVYRHTDTDELELLATTDRSFVASGRPEAMIEAQEGTSYLVRVALRAVDASSRRRKTAFTYGSETAPAWQRYLGRIVEAEPEPGDVEDAGLFVPTGLAVDGDTGRVVVATRENLAVYTGESDETEGSDEAVLSRTDTIDHVVEDGGAVEVHDNAILHWNEQASELYLVQEGDIFVVQGLNGGSKYLERCSADEDPSDPLQVATDESGRLYVLGSEYYRVEIYERPDSCEFELAQALQGRGRGAVWQLFGAQSLAVEPDGERLFVASTYGLTVLARDEGGEYSFQTRISNWDLGRYGEAWRDATVVLSDDGRILFVVGSYSPMVAAYRIRDAEDAETLERLAVVNDFFLGEMHPWSESPPGEPFYSHVPRPTPGLCVAGTAHGTTVDLFCDEQVVTVQWDEQGEEMFVSDWFEDETSDRFGTNLPDGLLGTEPRHIAESADGRRNYVLGQGDIGTLHVFERTLSTEEDSEPED